MPEIQQSSERYLRAPRFARLGGRLHLALIAWNTWEFKGGAANTEHVLKFPIGPRGDVGAPQRSEAYPAIRALGANLEPSAEDPALQAGPLHIHHRRGVAEVCLEGRVIWRARGTASSPEAVRAQDGWWIAWHHDVREDTGVPDIAKWFALRFVSDQGDVLEPVVAPPDRDRDRKGEEQGFEFPRLCVGTDGAIALFGRGSHNYWRQDLSAKGWTARRPLSDGTWGSRGRWVAAALLDDGHLITARRERRAIAIEVQSAPRGGPPALQPARIEPHLAALREAPRAQWIEPERDLRCYFGDIQQHTAHSDGCGSADEVYERARWRYGDDFVALTDHESFLGKRTGPGEWDYLQDIADRHDDPGRFATLIAYEWTGRRYPGPGHKCVYLPRRGMPLVSRDELPEGKDLVQRIRAIGGVASPHHIGWTGCDEPGHDPQGQPVWEICSCHGCYEHADHPLGMRGELRDQLVDVMLAKGHRFGFTASSDSHGLLWHHGESRKRDPYRTGLTGILAEHLNRQSVFDALRDRRCYATSGAKIRLDVRVGDAPMGSELRADGGKVRVETIGEGPIERLELVGAGGVIASAPGEGRRATLHRSILSPYVYARVIQTDGEMAWSSPIFFGRSS